MTIDKEQYMTAGELASHYNIPKQTLLYYDKQGLLAPAFINENNYRYYSLSQYLVLEIILNMRKLDIPIREIKKYLQHRDLDSFENILKEKDRECDKLIEKANELKQSLHLSLQSLDKIRHTCLEQIQLNTRKEKLLFISEKLDRTLSAKDRIKIFSRHNQTAFSRKSFKDLTTGWIIDKDDFLAQKFNATTRYFTSVSHPFSPKHCVTRPEGLYLTIRFQGTYYQKIVSIHEKIIDFMVKNNLKAVSDIYVYPLRNHWLTENTKEYINQISFQVQPYLDEE